MANYTYAQLEGLWISAGGSAATAPIAAAIAEAESGGNPGATSVNPDGGTNVGLWQLDTPSGKGAGFSIAQLSDPQTNAAVAVNGSSGGADWSAWATYANGNYKAFLSNSTTPDGAGLPPSTITATTAAAVSAQASCVLGIPPVSFGVGSTPEICFLSKSGLRGLLGGLCLGAAGILALAAAVILAASAFEHSGAASAVVKAGEAVTPVGRVVKAATPAARQERQLAGREKAVGQKERVSRLEKRERKAAQ